MNQSISFKTILGLLLLSGLTALGSQLILLISGAEDSPLEQWRQVGLYGIGLAVGLFILLLIVWVWRQNKVDTAERRLYLLAPRPRPGPFLCTFWQRAPGVHLRRGLLELPGDHLSFELGGDPHHTLFSLSVPATAAKAILNEASQEWPKVEIRPLAEAAGQAGDDRPLDLPRRTADLRAMPPRRDLWQRLLDWVAPAHGRQRRAEKLAAAVAAGPTWRWQTFRLKGPDFQPLKSVPQRLNEPRRASRLSGLLAAVEGLPAGTIGGIQVLVRPAPRSKRWFWEWRANLIRGQLSKRGSHSQMQSQQNESGDWRRATSQQYGPVNADQLQAELERINERLADGPLYEVCLRVWACGEAAEDEVAGLSAALRSQLQGTWNELEVAEKGEDGVAIVDRHFPKQGGLVMTAGELGQLFHLPDLDEAAPYARLRTAGAEPLAPEGRILVPRSATILAGSREPLTGPSLRLPARIIPGQIRKRLYGFHHRGGDEEALVGHDFREATTHTFICGATGAGKSVLGANLILQDWLAGHGALVIDPHRSLIDDILRGVPLNREGDVVLLDPGDLRQPFRFNLFEAGQSKETAIERLMAALRAGMEASWDSSVGMQEVLFHALTLTVYGPEPSMLRLLAWLDATQRELLLREVSPTSPQMQQATAFWQKQFPSWNGPDQKRALGAARRRVENFTRRALVRRALGQAGSTVNLAEALNGGKLVLCPMHDEMGEETKRIWSVLLLQELISLLMARQPGDARDPHAGLPPITVAIDELAESIGTLAEFVGTLLNETRKYGAAVILMNQSYVTLPQEVRQVILGNCRSQIALSLGVEDAAVAARIMGAGLTAEDLQRLRPFQAYARLAVGGGQAAPCLLRTLPPLRAEQMVEPQPPPTPPAGLMGIRPTPPAELGSHLSVADLLAWARHVTPQRTEAGDRLLAALRELPEEKYEEVRRLRAASDRWWAEAMVIRPGFITEKVGRICYISRLRYGIPWWQSDADYMRAGDAAARAVAEAKAAQAAEKATAQSQTDASELPEEKRETME